MFVVCYLFSEATRSPNIMKFWLKVSFGPGWVMTKADFWIFHFEGGSPYGPVLKNVFFVFFSWWKQDFCKKKKSFLFEKQFIPAKFVFLHVSDQDKQKT